MPGWYNRGACEGWSGQRERSRNGALPQPAGGASRWRLEVDVDAGTCLSMLHTQGQCEYNGVKVHCAHMYMYVFVGVFIQVPWTTMTLRTVLVALLSWS